MILDLEINNTPDPLVLNLDTGDTFTIDTEETVITINVQNIDLAVDLLDSVIINNYGTASWYTHTQIAASSTWNITHNLDKKPSVMVVDTSNNVVYGDILYVDDQHITLTFSAPFSGKAYLT